MMSEQVAMTDPVDLSIGGMKGHIFRRIFHLSMFFIPIVYFEYGMDFADYVDLTLHEVVSVIVIIAAIGEGIRLKLGFTVFGQRDYESGQVSALAWGAIGIGLVLLLVPTKEYAYPLIFSLTFGDPFMGEIRRRGVEGNNLIIYSSLFLLAIWLLCWNLFDTPLWLCFLMAPICVYSEIPRLRYIDDNATMLLIPLSVIIVLEPFIGIL